MRFAFSILPYAYSMSFADAFGTQPTVSVAAPGRVNLLGEHTDYNDGFVFPTPLTYQTHIEASKAEHIEAFAQNFKEYRTRAIDDSKKGDWLDYVAGCVWVLRQHGYKVRGIRAFITSEVPMTGGFRVRRPSRWPPYAPSKRCIT